jgi:hypothetical protein
MGTNTRQSWTNWEKRVVWIGFVVGDFPSPCVPAKEVKAKTLAGWQMIPEGPSGGDSPPSNARFPLGPRGTHFHRRLFAQSSSFVSFDFDKRFHSKKDRRGCEETDWPKFQ